MKTQIVVFLSFVFFCFSCTDNLDLQNLPTDIQVTGISKNEVILQERNPKLPIPQAKKISFDNALSRNINDIAISDNYLGYGYKLTNGNYIPSDFDNFTYSILDIDAIKEYDASYVDAKYPNWNDQSSYAYYDFNEYVHLSSISKTVKSGFSLNLGFFSIGKKKTTTETFRTFMDEEKEQTFGEMNILFAHGKFMLLSSDAASKVYARQFLRRSFVNSLYSSTISSILKAYGDFVVVGYYTGGRAFAQFMGNSSASQNVEETTKSLENGIKASFVYKEDSISGSGYFSFNGKDGTFDSTYYTKSDIFVQIKTFGGIQDGSGIINSTSVLKDINIDLQPWRKSLSDSKNHTVIDLTEEGLFPMSDFVLEKNFKNRFDDTSKGILLPVTQFYEPKIDIQRVVSRRTSTGEKLYDIAPVLVTRQGDLIVLSNGEANSLSDEELRANNNKNVFVEKAELIKHELSANFSSDIEIGYDTKNSIDPLLRNPLCLVLSHFDYNGFYKYYNAKTNMEYLYNPTSKICFSFFADEGDESILDVYGLYTWGSELVEKNISIATLANLYTIIGL